MSDSLQPQSDFDHLTPDEVLHQVEQALDVRCSNICRPLNSYINRVYEVILDDGTAVIAKFYRPHRWSVEALLEEHRFMAELAAEEIPVVAPLHDKEGETLFALHESRFALFPKKGGRICDEPSPDQWRELGRLVGRMHCVGAAETAEHRIWLGPEWSMRDHLETILSSGFLPREYHSAFEEAAEEVMERIDPLFDDTACIRVHGDLHHQNLLYRPGESFFLIDFDDLSMGPPVQDLWMLLPGRLADARHEVNLFLDGYEVFRSFDHGSLSLIEPLRAMRYLHFAAWCIRQAADGGFARLAPDWGTPSYWRQETQELRKQLREIEDALGGGAPPWG